MSNDQIGPDVMHRVDYDYKVSMQLYEDLSREINGSEVYIDLGNGSLLYRRSTIPIYVKAGYDL